MSKAKFIQENGETILPITHEEVVLDNDGKNLPSKYQQKQDENLLTDAKTIVGAINELSTKGGGEVTSDDVKFSDGTTVTDAHKDTISYIEDVEAVAYENKADIEEAMTVAYENKAVIGASELATNDKTLTGAINELFQSANNGKELIADAIGEPLSSSDTFSAMSNDINNLLSTFKTNMMRNGVTIESGDKFKSLIDKIATLSDSEGSDIQFSTGFINKTSLANKSNTNWVRNPMTFDTPLPFTPTRVIVSFPDIGMNTDISGNYYIGNISVDSLLCFDDNVSDGLSMYDVHGDSVYLYITNITNDGFDLYAKKTSSSKSLGTPRGIHWYAIGVGEEDTTLRDSLASILQDSGVEVTEEDDMASLIAKTDAKLDNSGGLDIISATELPATGKENQICIVSSDPNYDVLVTTNANESATSTFLVYLGNSSSADTTLGTQAQIGNMMYYFNRVMFGSERLPSYIWNNSQWNELTKSYIPLFENGEFPSQDVAGSTYITTTSNYARLATHSSNAGKYVIVLSGNASYFQGFSFLNVINFANFTKIKVKALSTSSTTLSLKVCCHSDSDQYGNFQVSGLVYSDYKDVSLSTFFTDISIDISSWTRTGKLCFATGAKSSASIYISKISLE